MTGLSLTITTPLSIALRQEGIASLRGEDASGGFGILPGHADFVTVIDAGVLRWRGADGPWQYGAVRGGVLSVLGGTAVAVACREAILGDDLPGLQARIAQARQDSTDAGRQQRSRSARLHSRAIRRLMQDLASGGDTLVFDGDGGT
ncbi:F0F1 ATP synthase subunit epsilon [Gemmobacter nectariphilus]|uniref:F0F1 ATP synthase subunit epsilon n=1 Tax=Gemmobacter nectariphilus TaxID=220343 RepID=UPI000409E585|nr:F0F1 ATP synthase subunit epsilon [Gemmobacter nectariphilus]